MVRVLIVEDDESMAVALRDGLAYEGYEVRVARDGATAIVMAAEGGHDLIVLDVMLPRMSGIDVCRSIRRGGSRVPIIMLTARGQEIDKVLGLRAGADDYVTKPFSFLELMARVEAVLRRSTGPERRPEGYGFGEIQLDFKRMEARKAGRPMELSHREFELLRFFVEHRGEVLSRERLLQAVWAQENGSLTRTVDVHVAKLRKKIEDRPADPTFIVTVHRAGYKFTG